MIELAFIPLRYELVCQEALYLKLLPCFAACGVPAFRLHAVIPSGIF